MLSPSPQIKRILKRKRKKKKKERKVDFGNLKKQNKIKNFLDPIKHIKVSQVVAKKGTEKG